MNKIDFFDINQPLNLEQEFGNGYIKLTDHSSNGYMGNYHIESEVLDEDHYKIGNLTIDGCTYNLHKDDHNFNIALFIEVDFKGDLRKANSLCNDMLKS